MFDTKLTPPTVDRATIDYYIAKGRRERSRAFAEAVRRLFSAPEPAERPGTQRIARKSEAAA